MDSLIEEVTAHASGKYLATALRNWVNSPIDTSFDQSIRLLPQRASIRCSVIVNSVDRAAHLAITLDELRNEWRYDLDELVIVLGPTNDESMQVIESAGIPYKLVRCVVRNLAVSRNLGLEVAEGRFVAFIDDDASPAPNWLDRLLEPLQRSESVGVCGGFIKDGNGNLFLNRYVVAETTGKAHFLQSKEDSIRKIAETGAHRAFQTATGCNMAFSRAALHVTGGFDRFYAYFLEETDLIKRMNEAGFFCAIAETSVVFHRLGTNITRQKTPDITERIAVIRSQIHYCGKFAKETCKSEEIELVIWERILTDLEKIAWESIGSAESCGPIQSSYLEAVERQLELDSGG